MCCIDYYVVFQIEILEPLGVHILVQLTKPAEETQVPEVEVVGSTEALQYSKANPASYRAFTQKFCGKPICLTVL